MNEWMNEWMCWKFLTYVMIVTNFIADMAPLIFPIYGAQHRKFSYVRIKCKMLNYGIYIVTFNAILPDLFISTSQHFVIDRKIIGMD